MMRITNLELQKRNKGRVNVYVDDEFAFACDAELIYVHSLEKGMQIDLDKLKSIVDEDNYIKCKNTALKSIERTYKSENEMLIKLKQKEFDDKTIAGVMKFLKEYDFVDDARFTSMYVNDKIKSYGKNKIRHSLARKGIDEKLLEEKLSTVGREQEKSTCHKLACKKYSQLVKSEDDWRKIYKKLGDFLARNGFSYELIKQVLDDTVKMDDCKACECHKPDVGDSSELKILAEKRHGILAKSESDAKKLYSKLVQYLMRRGYSYESIKAVLKDVLNEDEEW